jgi:hypothetical protein
VCGDASDLGPDSDTKLSIYTARGLIAGFSGTVADFSLAALVGVEPSFHCYQALLELAHGQAQHRQHRVGVLAKR